MNPNLNPNNLNNIDRDGYKQNKQISHISGPIKLDEQGNAIGAPIKRSVIESTKVKKEAKELDRSTFVFLIVMLIIVGVFVEFLIMYVLPMRLKLEEASKTTTTTTTTEVSMFKIAAFRGAILENGKDLTPELVNNTKTIQVDTDKILRVENQTWSLDFYMNDTKFASGTMMEATYGLVDDLVIFVIHHGPVRAKELIAIDSNGLVKLQISNVNNIAGMAIDNVSFNGTGIVLDASRVYGNQVITGGSLGETTGVDICNTEALKNGKIYDTSYATVTYSIGYNSTLLKFTDPQKISGLSIAEYKEQNKYCSETPDQTN